MKVIQIPVNPFNMNCYIYYDEKTGEGVIIDPAAFTEIEKNNITKIIEENKINIKYIINTHGHIDHILGNKFAKDYFKVPIWMNEYDLPLLEKANDQARFFGLDFPSPPPVDEYITEDNILMLADTKLKFIHTPGHSPGSVCVIDDNNKNIFCGDLIFKNSIGRTDLPGGDLKVLIDSIKNKLFVNSKDDYKLYPGHMEVTNIKDEKINNPFLE
ncbi:MAG: MBL fold metallo-hydrolase [bacterium]